MKKISFILISLLSFSNYAQPILNVSNVNPLNISGNAFFSVSSTVSVGSSGANVAWDFSTLELTSLGSFSTVSVSSAPFSSSFPTSNFFINTDGDFGYYNLTSSKLEFLGDSSSTSVGDVYANPETILVFPFTYNTVVNDTYQLNATTSIVNKSIAYDAYGTLITQFGTYNNVIRLKETIDGNIEYVWLTVNPYREIIRASFDSSDSSYTFLLTQPTNLSINENPIKTQFSIFPNPAVDNFTIKNDDFGVKEIFLNVFDVLGKQIIKKEKIESNSKNINISHFENGLYFVKITYDDNAVLYTSKIIKN